MTGDLNAKVGADNCGKETILGKHGCGTRNEHRELLCDICGMNNLVIGGTIFEHKDIHKLTWNSPNRRDKNQIDHINGHWKHSLQDVIVRRGADCNSDHHLLVAKVRLKLKAQKEYSRGKKKINIDQLQKNDIKEKFKTELRNRFAILQGKAVEINNNEPTLEKKWENIKTVYNETAKKVLGFNNKQRKKWIRDDTWKKIEDRRQIKAKINNARSERLKEQLQTKYSVKNKEVKKSARQDRKVYYEELASEAEEAARRREIGTVYKITKELAGKGRADDGPIKSKAGERLTTERQQMERWIEHFKEVLNIDSDTGESLWQNIWVVS